MSVHGNFITRRTRVLTWRGVADLQWQHTRVRRADEKLMIRRIDREAERSLLIAVVNDIWMEGEKRATPPRTTGLGCCNKYVDVL